MPCCGQKRSLVAEALLNATEQPTATKPTWLVAPQRWVRFQYQGKTALTVRGPISQARYRFGFPDAVVEVDERDAPSMLAVPNLKRI